MCRHLASSAARCCCAPPALYFKLVSVLHLFCTKIKSTRDGIQERSTREQAVGSRSWEQEAGG